ncbi:MAG: sugar transporter ATP-binding protein [Actinomycetia bacterium]|jgi:ribose transport system ATP-binding protein|nr:sugar transporter ATP-binding protein [Actinomycetes bacterium]
MKNNTPLLEMQGISKSFSGVTVLRDVGLRLHAGEAIGLLGENGAGKSTLIKVLCGAHSADSGTIRMNGEIVSVPTTASAQGLGIRTVYQELSLFPHLKVHENVFMHGELSYGPGSPITPLRVNQMRREASDLLANTLGIDVDVDLRVDQLTLGEQQLVEIARAVHAQARILILDEPTTTLERREKDRLFRVINDLRKQGTAIIFISHHLDEVLELCDRTVILRDGAVVLDEETTALDARKMIHAMSGKTPENLYPKKQVPIGKPVLAVEGLAKSGVFEDVGFELRQGEILGISGLVGCGKGEVVRALYGALRPDHGTVHLDGQVVRVRNIRQAKRLGISYLPADRKAEGIFPQRDVIWNATIAALGRFRGIFGLDMRKETAVVNSTAHDFGVRMASPRQQISRLSGGNQQKVLLARVLMSEPRVLLLEEPTRGIDVNAKTEMYQLITDFVEKGNSVVLVSSEETEVAAMCDRVLVMREGRVRATLDAADADTENIRLLAMSSDDYEETTR